MLKRWISLFVMLIMLMGVIAGCGDNPQPSTPQESETKTTASETLPLMANDMEEVQAYLNVAENNVHLFATYTEVTVIGGTKTTAGMYAVRYRPTEADSGLYIVTLSKTEDGYRFISNQKMQ